MICGPSGVGKGTLISKLLQYSPNKLGLSVSRTSRKPREGEINGVHYHFVSKDELEHDITNGSIKYIEHAKVHGNIYGTRFDAVQSVQDSGRICLLDVDVCGVKQLRTNSFEAKYVFVTPPSIADLETRLRGRGTENEEQIRIRLANAQEEIEYGLNPGNFDYVLVNSNVEESFGVLVGLLRIWFPDTNFNAVNCG